MHHNIQTSTLCTPATCQTPATLSHHDDYNNKEEIIDLPTNIDPTNSNPSTIAHNLSSWEYSNDLNLTASRVLATSTKSTSHVTASHPLTTPSTIFTISGDNGQPPKPTTVSTITGRPIYPRHRHTGDSKCANCQAEKTPMWRKGNAGEILCNKCGLYLARHGRTRPLELADQPTTQLESVKKRTKQTTKSPDSDNTSPSPICETQSTKRKRKKDGEFGKKKKKQLSDDCDSGHSKVTEKLSANPSTPSSSNSNKIISGENDLPTITATTNEFQEMNKMIQSKRPSSVFAQHVEIAPTTIHASNLASNTVASLETPVPVHNFIPMGNLDVKSSDLILESYLTNLRRRRKYFEDDHVIPQLISCTNGLLGDPTQYSEYDQSVDQHGVTNYCTHMELYGTAAPSYELLPSNQPSFVHYTCNTLNEPSPMIYDGSTLKSPVHTSGNTSTTSSEHEMNFYLSGGEVRNFVTNNSQMLNQSLCQQLPNQLYRFESYQTMTTNELLDGLASILEHHK